MESYQTCEEHQQPLMLVCTVESKAYCSFCMIDSKHKKDLFKKVGDSCQELLVEWVELKDRIDHLIVCAKQMSGKETLAMEVFKSLGHQSGLQEDPQNDYVLKIQALQEEFLFALKLVEQMISKNDYNALIGMKDKLSKLTEIFDIEDIDPTQFHKVILKAETTSAKDKEVEVVLNNRDHKSRVQYLLQKDQAQQIDIQYIKECLEILIKGNHVSQTEVFQKKFDEIFCTKKRAENKGGVVYTSAKGFEIGYRRQLRVLYISTSDGSGDCPSTSCLYQAAKLLDIDIVITYTNLVGTEECQGKFDSVLIAYCLDDSKDELGNFIDDCLKGGVNVVLSGWPNYLNYCPKGRYNSIVQEQDSYGSFKGNEDWKIELDDHPLFSGEFKLNNRDDNYIMKFTKKETGDDVEYPATVTTSKESMIAIRYSQPGIQTQIAHIAHISRSNDMDVESCYLIVNALALFKL